MDTIEIEGKPYQLASLGDRLVAQCIDGVIYAVFIVLPIVIFGGALAFFGVILSVIYLFFQDGLEGGQSLGKRLVNTRVVDEATGASCSYGQSLVRNLLLSILSFFDWIFIFGEKRQRLGDKAAKTVVVKA